LAKENKKDELKKVFTDEFGDKFLLWPKEKGLEMKFIPLLIVEKEEGLKKLYGGGG